jgi:hypothetical protein
MATVVGTSQPARPSATDSVNCHQSGIKDRKTKNQDRYGKCYDMRILESKLYPYNGCSRFPLNSPSPE